MPELPEVQTIVNDLLKLNIIGQTVKQIKVAWPAVAGFVSNKNLTHLFRQKKFEDIRRRGKYILFLFNDGSKSLLHLRMSGRLRYVLSATSVLKHEHLRILLCNDWELRFHDPRKFGRFIVGGNVDDKLDRLGMERQIQEGILFRSRRCKPSRI